MGQAAAKLRWQGASKSDPYRDSSVHSCRSVHPADEPGDLDVVGNVVVDESLEEGPDAALRAAIESLESGELSGPEAAALAKAIQRQSGKPETPPGQTERKSVAEKAVRGAQEAARKIKHEPLQQATNRRAGGLFEVCLRHVAAYFKRMRGGVDKPAKVPQLLDILLGWLGAFSSILVIAVLKEWASPDSHFDFLVASFGASAVLVFGAAEGKLSQPRNLIGGHVLSAVIGCIVRLILKDVVWLSSALGMAIALSIMQFTKTLHPPGGATALIAASAPDPLPRGSGFSFVLVVFVDACIMLLIGLLVNNIRRGRRYPTFWF